MWPRGKSGRGSGWSTFVVVLLVAGCRGDSRERVREQPQAQLPAARPSQSRFVRLEPGEVMVGSPLSESCRGDGEAYARVKIDHAFEVASLEVGQLEFAQVMGFDPSFNGGCAECPVDSVTYDEAAAYCNALSSTRGLVPCYACDEGGGKWRCRVAVDDLVACEGYRLPTEHEWEYAARAGTQEPTHAGPITSCMSTDEVAERIGWYKASSGGRTRARGQKLANPWGLWDMAGNVYEWTAGVVSAEMEAGGGAAEAAAFRSLRGGSWYHNAHHMRAASRLRVPARRRLSYAGFRCVRTVGDAG